MRKKVLVTILSMGLVSTAPVFAEEYSPNNHFGKRGKSYLKMYHKLDLSKAQKEALKTIFKNNRTANKTEQFEAFRDTQRQRTQLIQSSQLDSATLEQLADRESQRMRQHFINSTKAEHQAWLVLTPEQQEKLKKRQEKQRERMDKRIKKQMKKQED